MNGPVAVHHAQLAVDARAELGECPLWDPGTGTLAWIDIVGGEIARLDPASGAVERIGLGARIGSIALREAGGLLAALNDHALLLNASGAVERELPGPWAAPGALVNDGACDTAGRFWVGTATRTPGAAGLYRLDPDGGGARVLAGVNASNGLGWSPDDTVLFYVDSATQRLDALDCSLADGTLGARRPLVSFDPADGIPDGLAVDAEGCVWLAVWGAGEVRRYDPAGRHLATVRVPVSQVTSCAFGGPELDVLWITTAREDLDADALAAEPLAGGVFRAEPGVRGLPPQRFGA